VAFAEEVQFTNRYSEPLFQLNPENLMVVMCHSENTFNKLLYFLQSFERSTIAMANRFVPHKMPIIMPKQITWIE
jgi:hypothetical protein